jgi:hypothetical protein
MSTERLSSKVQFEPRLYFPTALSEIIRYETSGIKEKLKRRRLRVDVPKPRRTPCEANRPKSSPS